MAVTPPPNPQPGSSTWSRVLAELQNEVNTSGPPGFDIVRVRKIQGVEAVTGRPLILYVTAWTAPKPVPPSMLQLDLSDLTGFRDVTESIQNTQLDVLIHSPGGFAEAAESVVDLLRARFTSIRFIVPVAAKSAATMLAMSGNEIVMDDLSELGPIDPQFLVGGGGMARSAPADEILAQFEQAAEDIQKDQKRLPLWYPILSQMGPSLLAECRTAKQLSRDLVRKWLTQYMFANDPQGAAKAEAAADYLGSRQNFLSHGRRIKIDDLVARDVRVFDLRTNASLRQAVWELWCAIDITMRNTPTAKLYENGQGQRVIVRMEIQQGIQIALGQIPPPPTPPPQQPPQPPPPGPTAILPPGPASPPSPAGPAGTAPPRRRRRR